VTTVTVPAPEETARDRLLSNAGGLLIAAGAVAAFTGGSFGISSQRPGLILASIVLLMGYGIVGYLLMNHGERYFRYALPASAILVFATLVLFQSGMARFFDTDVFRYVLQPTLTLLLVFAAGGLLTHVVEDMTPRVRWPGPGARSLNALLLMASYAPVWCAFILVGMLGTGASASLGIFVLAASVVASIGCVVGAHAAARGNHPAFTVVGALLGFAASAAYLFQFMLGGGRSGAVYFGEFNALFGLILTGLPVAIGAVAWIQVNNPAPPAEEPRDATP